MINLKNWKIILSSIIIMLTIQGCYISRTSRPKLTGYVFDADTKQPLEGCEVGETRTDSRGFYELKENRYGEFTLPGFEAPPLKVYEKVNKEGYESTAIDIFKQFGGGSSKGSHWKIDPIYLKKNK